MAVNDDGVFYKRRELGLVNDVFTKDVLETMPRGNMCIGHCRYATTGVPVRSNAQPFVIRHIKGPMALAHNGNLTNSAELRSEFELSGATSTPRRIRRSSLTPSPASAFPPTASNRPWSKRWTG